MSSFDKFMRDLTEQAPLILSGLQNTILLAVAISLSGVMFGIIVFYFSQSKSIIIRRLTQAYISFFIGMPLIVLLFLIYYGGPQWNISMSPFMVAFLGFTLNIGAYNAAYLRTAYNSLNSTEIEAARTQGFSDFQIFSLVILPQSLRLSVPSLTNQIIRNLKDTSVAFLIQYTEFFARLQEVAATNFQFFWAYLFAAAVYLALVSVVVVFARFIEKRIFIRIPI